MISNLLDLIFPPKCMVCGKIIENNKTFLVCPECAEDISVNKGKRCKICAVPLVSIYGDDICTTCRKTKRHFDGACTPFIYEGGVRDAIKKYKFRNKQAYAKSFAAFMFAEIKSRYRFDDIDMITFVPLHFNRLGERGYNQSELLAENIGIFSDKPVARLLDKTVDTTPMYKTRTSKRAEVVKGIFELRGKQDISGKRILLIDDIITTGATVNECARVLKKGGASRVIVAAIASARG